MLEKARAFIKQFGKEMKKPIEQRLKEIEEEIVSTGTYTHTEEELVYGAKVAWRNSNKCIGRLFWNSLHVFDHRRLEDEEEILKHYSSIFAMQQMVGKFVQRFLFLHLDVCVFGTIN